MDVNLSKTERDLMLVALWQMKLSLGKPVGDDTGLPAGAGIDQVAFKLRRTKGAVYGLGEPPLGMYN
jgi:hypothetical protein